MPPTCLAKNDHNKVVEVEQNRTEQKDIMLNFSLKRRTAERAEEGKKVLQIFPYICPLHLSSFQAEIEKVHTLSLIRAANQLAYPVWVMTIFLETWSGVKVFFLFMNTIIHSECHCCCSYEGRAV